MAAATSSPSSNAPRRPTLACIRCAKRKVKCDRQRPCSACVNHKVGCVFQPSPPPPKRHRHVRDQILSERLRYYEQLLQDQGIDPSKLPDTPGFDPRHSSNKDARVVLERITRQTSSSVESEASGTVSKTHLIYGEGRSAFIDKYICSQSV